MRRFFKSVRPLQKKRRGAANARRLSLQSLENRRVLAATITSFTPTASGFTAELSEEVSTLNLNLYDTQGQAAGAADVTLSGATNGNVRGSLFVKDTTVTFIASGGALAPDTYSVTLRSAADAFTDLADGELLDGDNNGTAGGDYTNTFTVAAGNPLTVGLPDIVRGPTQSIQVPAGGSGVALPAGLPIQISNSEGVTSVTLTIQYDPALLDISDVQLGVDAPSGSQVESNLTVPGTATISFFSIAPLAAGQTSLVDIIASVPEDAPYGESQAIRITSLDVNAGALSATADDAVQVVAFVGDVNRNQRYDAEDARLIARVGVGLDSGFVFSEPTSASATTRLYPTIDPVLLGDVTGVDGLSPLDASDLLRRVVGLSTPNIPALPANQAPIDLSLSVTSVGEGQPIGTTVGAFTTNDPDVNQSHTYTLVTGTGSTDNASFTISGNQLKTAAVFDMDTKSSYTIRVRTTDPSGLTFEKSLVISVTEANEAPTAVSLTSSTVAENATVGTAIGTLSTTDANASDTHTYSIVSVDSVTGSNLFTVSGTSLNVGASLDFEAKPSHSVVVRTTDQAGLSFDQTLTITVTNINEAPTAIALSETSIAEDAVSGSTVGTFTSTDVDASDTHTYSLVTGTGDDDNASFTIDGNSLKTATTLDFGTKSSYSILVRSTDVGGLTFDQAFTITVTEVIPNVAPTAIALSENSIAEDAVSGSTVGTLSSTDANDGDTHTYTLVAGTGDDDNGSFTIDGNLLKTAMTLDFETQPSYTVLVRSTDDGGLSFDQTLTITVTNVNEAPTAIALSALTIGEDAVSGSTVGTFTSTDVDASDTHTYSLVTGTGDDDNGSFTIDGNSLKTATTLDFSTQSSYSVLVRSTDAGGLTFDQTFTITVTEVIPNVAPTAIALSENSIAEDAVSDSTVGTLSSTDANDGDTHTYTLVAGTGDDDNGSFTIDGNLLKTATTLDFETQPSYTVLVRSTDDGGLSFDQTLTITVTNVNEAPTAIALSALTIGEDAVSGSTVGTFTSTDVDASDTHTYSLVTGTGDDDNASFTIDGNSLKTATTLDFSTQSSYSVLVRSTDVGGLTFDQTFTITVTEVTPNVAPTAIALSENAIAEDAAVGTEVGTLSSADANVGDSHTYSLEAGTGDDDNASFTIDGNSLKTATTLVFSNQSSYSVLVRSTDAGGLTFDQTFTITVTEVTPNVAPTAIALSENTIAEDAAVGTEVGTLSSTDANVGDSHTYSLEAGTGDDDNASFTIDGNSLKTATTLDFSTRSSYSVLVRSTDAGGLTFDQTFTITVTEVTPNVAPTAIALSENTIAEDAAVGTEVGTLSSTDANVGDSHTYSLEAGTGDDDNASFTIDGNSLKTATTLDFSTQSSYSVLVRSTDAGGLTFDQTFTITVTEVTPNVAPTAIALSENMIAEDAAVGTEVGTLSSTDANVGDSHTYSLEAGTGDDNNASFTIDGNSLKTATTLDFSTQSSYSVRIRSTDAGGETFEETFTITVTEVANVAPTAIALSESSIPEDAVTGTEVGLLSSTDANVGDSHTYSLEAGTGDDDNALFTIDGNSLKTATSLDFETQPSYSVRVRSTDLGGATFEQDFTITVTNVNEAPTAVAVSRTTIASNEPIDTEIGLLSSEDPDAGDSFTYTVVSVEGETTETFNVSGGKLVSSQVFDAAIKDMYAVTVRTEDAGGLTFDQVLQISISEDNEAPVGIAIDNSSIAANSVAGTTVGSLTTTDPNTVDEHVYLLVDGAGSTDNASFTIEGNVLKTSVDLDSSSPSTFSIRVQSLDRYGLSTEVVLTLTVEDVV
ncbi:beta strand repeat-containing protein [Novipirellula sp. SH528]|uniref:beta strand repeat-containing protein n=1 Tax=Novipirellula sp. SH528 TaxID=3454466 RepID=UPI003FA0198D